MKKLLLAAVLFTALFTSCKKENNVQETPVNLGGVVFKGRLTLSNQDVYDPTTITLNSNGTANFNLRSSANNVNLTYPGSWSKMPNSNIVYFFMDEIFSLPPNKTYISKWKWQGNLNANANKIESGTISIAGFVVTNGIEGVTTNSQGTFTLEKQ
jgi:hypothetical protein